MDLWIIYSSNNSSLFMPAYLSQYVHCSVLQETHIIHNFKEDFYGSTLKVCMLGYLRPMKNFSSLGKYQNRNNLSFPRHSCNNDLSTSYMALVFIYEDVKKEKVIVIIYHITGIFWWKNIFTIFATTLKSRIKCKINPNC